MNRRAFLSSTTILSTLAIIEARAGISTFVGESFKCPSESEIGTLIDKRIANANVDYFAALEERPEILARMNHKSPDSVVILRTALNDPQMKAHLEYWRVKGLNNLKRTSIEPRVKKLLLDLNTDLILHEVATCLDHFLGVHEILRRWGHSDDVALAGLFHAVYGTSFNQLQILNYNSIAHRSYLTRILGPKAEYWARLFGIVDPNDLIVRTTEAGMPTKDIFEYEKCVSMKISGQDFAILADLLVANSFEPYEALHEPDLVKRLRQFEFFRPYLSVGARSAIDLVQHDKIPISEVAAGRVCNRDA